MSLAILNATWFADYPCPYLYFIPSNAFGFDEGLEKHLAVAAERCASVLQIDIEDSNPVVVARTEKQLGRMLSASDKKSFEHRTNLTLYRFEQAQRLHARFPHLQIHLYIPGNAMRPEDCAIIRNCWRAIGCPSWLILGAELYRSSTQKNRASEYAKLNRLATCGPETWAYLQTHFGKSDIKKGQPLPYEWMVEDFRQVEINGAQGVALHCFTQPSGWHTESFDVESDLGWVVMEELNK